MCKLKQIFIILFILVFHSAAQATDRFTISADGQEVKDNKTQLIWQRCPWRMVWSVNLCYGPTASPDHQWALMTATSKGWRIPNIKELASIVDTSHYNPAIDTLIFPATPSTLFWSSSPVILDDNDNIAWVVDFKDG